MIRYATRDDLLRIGRENVTESRAKVAKAQSRDPSGLTFLSHSSKDNDLMPGVVRILENHGATVYLDKIDASLTTKSVREIAKTLRSRIQACKKFVLFASTSVKSSTWVPWELGLADGFKRSTNVAIFPSVDNMQEQTWTEQEYLGVYDRVIWGNYAGQSEHQWLVWNQIANTAMTLRAWLGR